MKQISKEMKTPMNKINKKVVVGAGAAAGAAALGAALYYLYATEGGKKERVKIEAWMKDARKDIVGQVKKLKDSALTEENYRKIVKEVSKRYQTLKKIEPDDVAAFAKDLHAVWSKAKKHMAETKKAPAKKKKPVVKK